MPFKGAQRLFASQPLHIPTLSHLRAERTDYYLSTEVGDGFADIIGSQQTITLGVSHCWSPYDALSHSLSLMSVLCLDRFVTGDQKLNHYQESQHPVGEAESDFMIHGNFDVAKLSYDTLGVSATAESVFGKSKKSRKKNRWQPYTVVPIRVFCRSSKTDIPPYTSKKRLRSSSECHDSPPYTPKKRLRSSSGCHERIPDEGILSLPNELVVKVLSNLDIRDVSVCRLVNHRWHALVDELHLQARAFTRFLHYQPTPQLQTVENYHFSTRSWLRGFGIRGKEWAEQLDELLEHKYFPEILLFAIAEVLAKTRLMTCQSVCTFEHSDWVTDARFSPDGRHLVTASTDHTAQIWELVAGQWRKKVTIRHSKWVFTAIFSPDGHYLLTADRTAQIWELVAGQWQQKTTIQHSNTVTYVGFSPDGRHLVTASIDRTAQIWELVAGQWQQKTIIRHSGPVDNASFSPDGRHLVTASADHTGQIWELVAGQWQQKTTIRHAGSVLSASFSLDGRYLVTTSVDNTAQIWKLVAGQWQKKTTIQHSSWVNNTSFSPNGRYLATASDDGSAQIWELVAGKWQQKVILRHSMAVTDASFSPDGCHLATASFDGSVKIWSFVAGQWQQEMDAIWHSMAVNHHSFSPDGSHLVTTSDDHTVKILGRFAGQWQEKATISHTGVKQARFSPDGSQLLTASTDGTAKVWLLKNRENNDIS